ncbi:TIGR03667 family PPOX class F420-dependent oxidoreductase [Nocardiopsis sediminis]|uniref:TIGR03667 family PPOX class F420-dependent oxidoreductase n=1 Tax=Nocardiopsis sediminis TaxID=1778267 RepID=A0ABV8FV02_9ACTN
MTFEPSAQLRRRIADDRIVWLTTVSPTGRPSPRPVWFAWDDAASVFVVRSQPGTAKLRHIAANPNVALNFNSSSGGGDVLVVHGTAEIAGEPHPLSGVPGYIERYGDGMTGLGLTPDTFEATYSEQVRITPQRTWGF